MLINATNISAFFTGCQTSFNTGFEGAETQYGNVAMTVTSTTSDENYGWLGQFPKFREWIGPRHLKSLMAHGFTIKNRDFENTISVDRNALEDDKYGIYGPMFQELGRSAAELPDELVFSLIADGFTGECYDGQPFFDADHPVETAEGAVTTASNVQAGSSEPWYLFDASRAVKPIIYQERRAFNRLISKDREEDDNVFFNKEYIYGSDGRANVGYGLWQLAFGSKATLNVDNYKAARAAMMELRGESGRPLGVKPTVMIVPPSLEEAALTLLNTEYGDGGASNVWKGTATLIVTPWCNTSGVEA